MSNSQHPQNIGKFNYKLVKIDTTNGSLEGGKGAFLRSFHHQYKRYDVENDLGLQRSSCHTTSSSSDINGTDNREVEDRQVLEQFLQMAFAEEIARFDRVRQNGQSADGKTVEYFFQVEGHAIENQMQEREEVKVVGYASLQHKPSDNHCYIHQLGVCPSHWGSGIGKSLVFALRDIDSEKVSGENILPSDLGVSSISILTRRINEEGIDFYKHIGFDEVVLQATEDDYLDFTKYIQMEWKEKD